MAQECDRKTSRQAALAERSRPAALTRSKDCDTNWNFMVENGQTVSVGSDVLFGGSGFEYGRGIGFEPYCSTLSVVSIFLADAMWVRGSMQNALGRGDKGSSGNRSSAQLFQPLRRSCSL